MGQKILLQALSHLRAIDIQRYIRGYLARRAFRKKRRDIIICQAAVRRFIARRYFIRMKNGERTVYDTQRVYKAIENKIVIMQKKIDELNRENSNLKNITSEISELKMKLEIKASLEDEINSLTQIVRNKDKELALLNQQLVLERDEKMELLQDKVHSQEEWIQQKQIWSTENGELRKGIYSMIDMTKTAKSTPIQPKNSMDRMLFVNHMISEIESNTVNEKFNCKLREREMLDNEKFSANEENSFYQTPDSGDENNYTFCTISNATSQSDDYEDCSSFKAALNRDSIQSLYIKTNFNDSQCIDTDIAQKSEPEIDQSHLIFDLRQILDEEKKKNGILSEDLQNLMNRNESSVDSTQISELEAENGTFHNRYDLLRNSLQCDPEMEELDKQYQVLEKNMRTRQTECIKLRNELKNYSASLNNASAFNKEAETTSNNELSEEYRMSKVFNQQLKSELKILTEESKTHLAALSQHIGELQDDKAQLQIRLQKGLGEIDENNLKSLRQTGQRLRDELDKSLAHYAQLQEQMNVLASKLEKLKNSGNDKFTLQLDDHETNADIAVSQEESRIIIRESHFTADRVQEYQGLMKFLKKDVDAILKCLVTELKPRVAITLLPGFSAYIIFMCIRYADVNNSEEDVRELLSKFVLQIRKIHRKRYPPEMRTLWLVNCITLLNLLRQYGDIKEYAQFNTEKQNSQRLKSFNFCEYRRVVLEIIVHFYHMLVRQIQVAIEPYIVPALLENLETKCSRLQPTLDAVLVETGKPKPWKQLIKELEHFYKQFQYFGMARCYSDQIFRQLFYFISATGINYLMLRSDLYMWETGMVIRYNLGYLEGWLHEKIMPGEVQASLDPLHQYSQLLQSRKSEHDVQVIFNLCTSLNIAQVMKVMKSYKPDDYEVAITSKFLEKLTIKFKEREDAGNDELTIETKFIHPFRVLFKHSEIQLQDIELPDEFNLKTLLTKL